MLRPRLATAITACNVALTLTAVIGGLVSMLLGIRTGASAPLLDRTLAVVLWGYALGVPVLTVVALIIGDRRTQMIKLNYYLLAVWLLLFAWTSTMTLAPK